MENKEISLILFGKPKAFEIYELFENGAIKNIETENQGPEFLPVSISDNICHFYKRKGFYYYEVYSEAFANNVTRAGNLIGFCIKSKNKIIANAEFLNVLFANYRDIKNASLENNTFIYSSLLNDFINKIKIEKSVSKVILSINSFATQNKNFKVETRLIERGDVEISSIQVDLDKYEYYISQDDRIFKDAINKQKFVELGEQVYILNKSGKVIPKETIIIEPKFDNNLSINLLNRRIQQSDNVDEIKKLLKQKDRIIWKEQQKTKKRNMVIIIICILFAIGGGAFGWYSDKMNKEIADKESSIASKQSTITGLSNDNNKLEIQRRKLQEAKTELDTKIDNKKKELVRLQTQAKGKEADLRNEIKNLEQELSKANDDLKDYKKSHTVSDEALKENYIPRTEIDNKKYFDQNYIKDSYVLKSKYKELEDKIKELEESAKTNTNNGNNSVNALPTDSGNSQKTDMPNEHIVKQGETLTFIATKYNTTVDKLKTLNNISSNSKIKEGLKLKLK